MAAGAPEPFTIPSEVTCSDGPCGRLVRVVVDPVAKSVTHLVIEPRNPGGPAKLVPLDRVGRSDGHVQLALTRREFDELEGVRELDYIEPGPDDSPYGRDQSYVLPYYGLGYGAVIMEAPPPSHQPHRASYDRIPLGEVEVRRGERVYAKDGAVGHVQGLVIDPADHHVTHVLLQEGHLWGAKQVAIPITSVTGIEDGIRVDLTKDEIGALPAVPLSR